MITTDYTEIANNYDENPYRIEELGLDQDLKFINAKRNDVNVLDLSCGTGLYLNKQMNLFKGHSINWYGLDKSIEMLGLAKKRATGAKLTQGIAEDLPYEGQTFDYIVNNFAFHHYEDKSSALDEIVRVLKQDGLYKMHNIAIHDMQAWWVYHYFPEAFELDIERFWSKDRIFNELITRGLDAEITIDYQMKRIKVKDYLFYVENKDISVLTLLSDEAYQTGFNKMKNDVNQNENYEITVDFAILNCLARKSN